MPLVVGRTLVLFCFCHQIGRSWREKKQLGSGIARHLVVEDAQEIGSFFVGLQSVAGPIWLFQRRSDISAFFKPFGAPDEVKTPYITKLTHFREDMFTKIALRDGWTMESVVIVIHLLIVAALVVVVLLQRSEGGALGIGGGGGGGGGFLTGRSAANLLTRTTAILAAGFFITSLGLGILATQRSAPSDVLDNVPAQTGSEAPTSGQGGILDELQQLTPTAPAAPTGPQVPTSE